jgi:hypothetical protein
MTLDFTDLMARFDRNQQAVEPAPNLKVLGDAVANQRPHDEQIAYTSNLAESTALLGVIACPTPSRRNGRCSW